MGKSSMDLDIIVTPKDTSDGQSVIQVSLALFRLSNGVAHSYAGSLKLLQELLSNISRMHRQSKFLEAVSYLSRIVQISCSLKARSTIFRMVK